MRCDGSKPCQGHIKRQHSGKIKYWKMVTNRRIKPLLHTVILKVQNVMRRQQLAVVIVVAWQRHSVWSNTSAPIKGLHATLHVQPFIPLLDNIHNTVYNMPLS